jgi:vacuolar-type H+-ATPase subunit C/Vma6
MSRQYHYLVAGLPELLFDEKKPQTTLKRFRDYLNDHLSFDEMLLLNLLFWKFDNNNILEKLQKPDFEINPLGNLNNEEIEELIAAQKSGSLDSLGFYVPEYIVEFIEAFKNSEDLFTGKPWDLQLSELYYRHISNIKNQYIKDWFVFEKDLSNLLTAYNCRINDIPIEKHLIGKGELIEKLIKSSARDFGINDEIEGIEKIFKALDEEDLLEQERKIDLLKWEMLDESSFFFYFSIERLFVFLIKLSIADRWLKLDKETGLKLFKELLNNLETSYEFPAEFGLK